MNNREVAPGFDVVNAATTPAQIATNVSLKFIRSYVFDLHDGLEKNGFALLKSVFHGENRRQFKCQFAGIDFVERAVNNIDLYINNRIPPSTPLSTASSMPFLTAGM